MYPAWTYTYPGVHPQVLQTTLAQVAAANGLHQVDSETPEPGTTRLSFSGLIVFQEERERPLTPLEEMAAGLNPYYHGQRTPKPVVVEETRIGVQMLVADVDDAAGGGQLSICVGDIDPGDDATREQISSHLANEVAGHVLP